MLALTTDERYALWLIVRRAVDAETIPQDIDANAVGTACLKLEPLNTSDYPFNNNEWEVGGKQ